MTADALCRWLDSDRPSQREKLQIVKQQYVQKIRAMYDADHGRVLRALKKHLKSPKLAEDLAELIAQLVDRPANPGPEPEAPVAGPYRGLLAPPGTPIREQLETAIAADPGTRDGYLVLGDVLEAAGHPQGALIAIGDALAKNPTHAAMLAAHRKHIAAHGEAILGSLVGCEDIVTGVEWFMGFIRKARVASTWDRYNTRGVPVKIEDVIGWLLDTPGPGRFLRELVVGIVQHDQNHYAGVAEVIARRPRPTLEKLYFGDFDSDECELNWSEIGDVAKLWPAVPNLRDLTLRSGSMTVGPIHLPRLESFTTITGGLDPDSLGHIAAADWPVLRRFSLQIGSVSEGAAGDAEVLAPVLAATRVPALRALGIVNCEFVDDLLRRLADAPLLAQLASIDVSMGTMSLEGVEVIEAHRARFAHVELDVDDNYLPAAAQGRLAACVRSLRFGDQRDDGGDPDDRQASAIE